MCHCWFWNFYGCLPCCLHCFFEYVIAVQKVFLLSFLVIPILNTMWGNMGAGHKLEARGSYSALLCWKWRCHSHSICVLSTIRKWQTSGWSEFRVGWRRGRNFLISLFQAGGLIFISLKLTFFFTQWLERGHCWRKRGTRWHRRSTGTYTCKKGGSLWQCNPLWVWRITFFLIPFLPLPCCYLISFISTFGLQKNYIILLEQSIFQYVFLVFYSTWR